MMEIDTILPKIYTAFISAMFRRGSVSISLRALDLILSTTALHTFYVQYLCNRLYSEYTKIETDQVDMELLSIVRENEPVYANYLNLLTSMQFRVLKAVAPNESIDNPTSKEFLSKYNLGAASSVSQAIKSLSDKEFVFQTAGRYRLNDVFLHIGLFKRVISDLCIFIRNDLGIFWSIGCNYSPVITLTGIN